MKCPTLSFVGILISLLGGIKLNTVIAKKTIIAENKINFFIINNQVLFLFQQPEFLPTTIWGQFFLVNNSQKTDASEY